MSPVPSSEGLKTSWINYHTGVKNIHFRMEATQGAAIISITLEHPDAASQQIAFEQFSALKTVLHKTLGERWKWKLHEPHEGKVISRIYKELPGVSVFNKADWPDLISFFKPRIMALDAFWEDAKYSFDGSV